MKVLAVSLLLLTGCATKKPIHAPLLSDRAYQFVDHAKDTLKAYRADERASQYEQEEIAKVQADIDGFNFQSSGNDLWIQIDRLVADMEQMSARDAEISEGYVL